MSVLIKGMKMPQNCAHCELFHDEGFCIVTGTSIKPWGEKRNADCPLVELPDHGDLIDRDALKESAWCADTRDGFVWVVSVRAINAETAVIPAERSEDGEA